MLVLPKMVLLTIFHGKSEPSEINAKSNIRPRNQAPSEVFLLMLSIQNMVYRFTWVDPPGIYGNRNTPRHQADLGNLLLHTINGEAHVDIFNVDTRL